MEPLGIFYCVDVCRGKGKESLTRAIGSPAKGLLLFVVFLGMLFLGVQVPHARLYALARTSMLGNFPLAETLRVYASSRILIAHCEVNGKILGRARLKLALLSVVNMFSTNLRRMRLQFG